MGRSTDKETRLSERRKYRTGRRSRTWRPCWPGYVATVACAMSAASTEPECERRVKTLRGRIRIAAVRQPPTLGSAARGARRRVALAMPADRDLPAVVVPTATNIHALGVAPVGRSCEGGCYLLLVRKATS